MKDIIVHFADSQQQQERMEICKSCPHYRSWAHQCRLCGCLMPFKVKFKDQHCPIKKWDIEL